MGKYAQAYFKKCIELFSERLKALLVSTAWQQLWFDSFTNLQHKHSQQAGMKMPAASGVDSCGCSPFKQDPAAFQSPAHANDEDCSGWSCFPSLSVLLYLPHDQRHLTESEEDQKPVSWQSQPTCFLPHTSQWKQITGYQNSGFSVGRFQGNGSMRVIISLFIIRKFPPWQQDCGSYIFINGLKFIPPTTEGTSKYHTFTWPCRQNRNKHNKVTFLKQM